MDLKKIQKKIWKFQLDSFNSKLMSKKVKDEKFYSLGLAGEVGEYLNMIKKEWRGDKKFSLSEKGEELADIFIYLVLLISVLDLDLEEIVLKKFEKVKDRIFKGYYSKS